MYEYKFEKVELKGFFTKPQEDHHEIIREHAKDGWRLVQIFAPSTSSYGMASYFELIFEREVQ
ncbi:uncharacterized protein JNUCC1_01577 [Lentibacillus sp. JNUCC-1]|uniref:DUF4177 domain-containing protein n=1 Tax=Lentibacillus sp. JNUCC-1 TaxID=2654513 RepID=UPI0012E82CCE|nr:DUF4177 domain-containing protein [Lentibacillus sp. JNUCC-1]MUV37771.1 uncharacterized protein [Lentibacillus sp. JNUCC-1]